MSVEGAIIDRCNRNTKMDVSNPSWGNLGKASQKRAHIGLALKDKQGFTKRGRQYAKVSAW